LLKTKSDGEFENQENTLRAKTNLREGRARGENDGASNNSMDVRRKQLLCYQRRLFTLCLCGCRFRPRHLSRSVTFMQNYAISNIYFCPVPSIEL